jgi:hypothetical protein
MDLSFRGYVHPPESYSRELDREVAREEKPYGYTLPPPPADTGDFNQRRLESDKQYRLRKGRAI